MIRKFNHVGIAVRDLENAVAFFGDVYGTRLLRKDRYEDELFESAIVETAGMRIELLAGLAPESFISQFVKERGEGIHHMSLEVEQFEAVVQGLKFKRLTILGETENENFKACFVHPRGNHGILTEIIEPKPGWPV
ncbi:VOC family protein [Desulfatiglans anilini]|uniref:VOC family protein n=1 Tax=Desulfatiglans anilini TaxID=90728 RepID=UPI000410A85B|nr:VOC family protein [Desulfatiglans anilini]